MSLQLPSPSEDRLRHPPLQLVVCQVRHEPLGQADLKHRAVAVHRRLRDAYPVLRLSDPMPILVAATPTQQLNIEPQHGWQLVSGDSDWTAVVADSFFALETKRYLDWADFRARFQALATVVADESGVASESRLGLRYVDRLTDPAVTKPSHWAARLNQAFAGPLATEQFGDTISAHQGLLQLTDAGRAALVRYGSVPSESGGGWDFMFDQDCSRETGLPFELEGIYAELEELHKLGLQLFQFLLLPDYYEALRGKK